MFKEIPLLGALHLYCIRGWGTILNAIGQCAFINGSGASLIQRFRDCGVWVHYYEKYGAIKFGAPGSKGHDALSIWLNIEKVLVDLPYEDRVRLADIVHLWTGMWFLVACPRYLLDGRLPEPFRSVEEVGMWLERFGGWS